MNFIKKKISIKCIITFIIVLILTGCGNKNFPNENITINDNYKFVLSKKENCSNELIEYYQFEDRKILLVCLDEVYLQDDINTITLKEYFQYSDETFQEKIDNLISKLNFISAYYDGGTSIYKNDTIGILGCKTENSNDIYIGDIFLKKELNFCQ